MSDIFGGDDPYDGNEDEVTDGVDQVMSAAGEDIEVETAKEKAQWLEEHLSDEIDKDRGYVGRNDVLDDLALIWVHDKAGWLRIEPIMRAQKLLAITKREVCRRVTDNRNLRIVEGPGQRLVIDVIEGAPVPPETEIPAGWEIRRHTTHGQARLLKRVDRRRGDSVTTDFVPVASDHMLVASILTDVDNDETHLEIAYSAGKRWVHRVIPREVLASPRNAALSLTGYGFPIHGNNAPDVLQWLIDFEALNVATLPRRRITRQMGWQRGDRGFVVGDTHLRDDDEVEIHFQGSDVGDQHLVRCLQPAGTYDEWAKGAGIFASDFPDAELAIYASLAPPLLEILQTPNFVVEWSGKTSTGKTTAMALAASVWGQPDDKHRDSFITSWDNTQVFFERRAANLNGLPLLLDDTKTARCYQGKSIVPAVLFGIANGQGRGRGSIKGTQAIRYWRTVMLSTGENRCVDFDKSGGTAARVVTLWGLALGPKCETTADRIQEVNSLIYANHGHAGKLWVDWLRAHKEDWPAWRERFKTIRSELRSAVLAAEQRPNDVSVADRLAGNLAVIELVGELAHEALDLPWEHRHPAHHLINKAASGAKVADREIEALGLLASHLSSNLLAINRESVSENDKKMPPRGEWLGWLNYREGTWSLVAVYPEILRKLLAGWGFEPNAILRRWREDGVIKCEPGRITNRVAITEGGRPRMVVFDREAIEEAGFDPDGVDDEVENDAKSETPPTPPPPDEPSQSDFSDEVPF